VKIKATPAQDMRV